MNPTSIVFMGFYVRKSLRFGPLRLNLSSSGIGASVGVKGFRIGSGPKGNYVHAGRGGIYYRRTLASGNVGQARPSTPQPETGLTLPPGARGPCQTIDSASTLNLVDETSAELIQELDEKKRRLRRWPLGAVVLAVGLGWAFWNRVPQSVLLVLSIISVLCFALLIWWDRYKKTTVIFYDLDAEFTNAFQRLFSAVLSVKRCARTWNINSTADVYDSKYVGGADQLLDRELTHISESGLRGIKTNVSVLTIGAGTQTLAFMPDRLLVFDTAGVGAVDYRNLNLRVQGSKFIETGAVPKDAVVVGQTWQFTNKRLYGGICGRKTAIQHSPHAALR